MAQAALVLDCVDEYGVNNCTFGNTRTALCWLLHKKLGLLLAQTVRCDEIGMVFPPTCSDWILCPSPVALTPSKIVRFNLHARCAFVTNLESMLLQLGLYISQDALLVCKLARIVQMLVKFANGIDQCEKHTCPRMLILACLRILRRIVLPALSLMTPNPGIALEIWTSVKDLRHEDRRLLYLAWRGRSLEDSSPRLKHYELSYMECTAGFEARRMLKRVANERRFSKHVGRQLAKVSHSNPLMVFHVILSQIESYDNMIVPLIDSLSYMTPLALDILAFMLPQRFVESTRAKILPDGMTLSQWFQHLAHFTGLFYRAYPMTELRGLIDFILSSLRRGTSHDLIILSDVLMKMGGCNVLADISGIELNALAGGVILRRETLVFERASRRAVLRLQQILRDSKLALPLLALIGQQCVRSLFQIDMNHVKLAGQSHDKCLHVFYQLVEFLSCPIKRRAGKSGGYTSSLSYCDEVVEPDIQMLCKKFKMELHFAFCVARATMAVALDHRR
mmetsp:Transcript_19210/g.59204  ORF Transcript_19210/g.59204 Transcript_19210/m.59204 type:complete len:507 (+) Transcript_19210:1265-2785(+)